MKEKDPDSIALSLDRLSGGGDKEEIAAQNDNKEEEKAPGRETYTQEVVIHIIMFFTHSLCLVQCF